MKRFSFLLMLAAACVSFMGCPYETEVAIDENPSVAVDQKLLGTWESKSSSDYTYKLEAEDENTYAITKKGADSETKYYGFESVVDGTRYLNIIESEGSKYYLYKITTSASKATLKEVSDNITETFETSAALKAFIKKNQSLSFFVNKEEDVYYKAD